MSCQRQLENTNNETKENKLKSPINSNNSYNSNKVSNDYNTNELCQKINETQDQTLNDIHMKTSNNGEFHINHQENKNFKDLKPTAVHQPLGDKYVGHYAQSHSIQNHYSQCQHDKVLPQIPSFNHISTSGAQTNYFQYLSLPKFNGKEVENNFYDSKLTNLRAIQNK
jgi:hypothetical protein